MKNTNLDKKLTLFYLLLFICKSLLWTNLSQNDFFIYTVNPNKFNNIQII